jgi:hypothetical protein
MGSEKRADQAWDFLSNWFTSGFHWVAVTLPAAPGCGFGVPDALFWAATGRRWLVIVFQAVAAGLAGGAILGITVILSMRQPPGAPFRRFLDIHAPRHASFT